MVDLVFFFCLVGFWDARKKSEKNGSALLCQCRQRGQGMPPLGKRFEENTIVFFFLKQIFGMESDSTRWAQTLFWRMTLNSTCPCLWLPSDGITGYTLKASPENTVPNLFPGVMATLPEEAQRCDSGLVGAEAHRTADKKYSAFTVCKDLVWGAVKVGETSAVRT